MNITLQAFRQIAVDALNQNPTGDTVIRMNDDKTGLKGHKWTKFPNRSADEKLANLAVRQALVQAFRNEIGDLKFDKKTADLLKIYDFKFDDNGEVTSNRPLTARRIIALTDAMNQRCADAIAGLNSQERECFDRLNENTAGWGGNIPVGDKITLAKEMAKPASREFQGLTKLKMQHVLIGFDCLAKLRENPARLMKKGTPMERVKNFAKQIGERIGKSFRDACNESNAYLNEERLAAREKRPSKAVKTRSIERYGAHEYGGDDMTSIMRSVMTVLLTENKELKSLCEMLDKQAFNTMMEDFTDNEISNSNYRRDDAKMAANSARVKYLNVKEGRKPGDLEALKKAMDEAEADAAKWDRISGARTAEGDVYSCIARMLAGGKAFFDGIV